MLLDWLLLFRSTVTLAMRATNLQSFIRRAMSRGSSLWSAFDRILVPAKWEDEPQHLRQENDRVAA